MTESRELRIKRLAFRSWHRGCKETDLVLGHFCDAMLENLSDTELDTFEQLLEESDVAIWAWLTEKEMPEARYASLLTRLRTYNQERLTHRA